LGAAEDSDAKVPADTKVGADVGAAAEGASDSEAPGEAGKATAYRGDEPKKPREKPEPPTLWQRATYRWTAITSVMAGLLVIYTQHPYYLGQQFAPFRPYFTFAFIVWLALGLFYVKATLQKFGAMRYMMRDGGLHLLLVAKAIQQRRFWKVAKTRRIRTTLLGILVKAFYTPLMTGFISGHANGIAEAWLRHKHLAPLRFIPPKGNAFVQTAAWFTNLKLRLPDFIPNGADLSGLLSPGTWTRADLGWGLGVTYDIIFFVDCGVALIGYSLESRWLGNKTRSVEPTMLGWAAALSCYPPYNNVLGTYLPLDNGPAVITGENALLALRVATVLLFSIYAAATVAFGFKFSNLTNRGIISRGPYRLVRHPAYLTKCTAWWLEHLPTITLTKAFFLTLLCGVYALRAWTEERHLSMDPDYLAYKKKVPWILFPGVY
jgi:hypothetical protein